jgi:cell division protein FtsZ
MDEMGKAMMGTGEAEGEDRAIQAAEKAIANPLLDEISLQGRQGRADQHHRRPRPDAVRTRRGRQPHPRRGRPDANIIVGSTLDPDMEGMMRVSVVATGIDAWATPSQETMARLHAPCRAPRAPRRARSRGQSRAPSRPRATIPRCEKSRFGINSLINRMTGHAADAAAPVERRQPPVSAAPQRPAPTAADDGVVDPDQERIEIPAFLRRQAN